MSAPYDLPAIAMTMGDPAGIGPEICLDALRDAELLAQCHPVLFGDRAVLEDAAAATGRKIEASFLTPEAFATAEISGPVIVDFALFRSGGVVPGNVKKDTGAAGYKFIEQSIYAALEGKVAGVATGPIHKEALHAAGVPYPGHTEIFAALTKAPRACMMLTSEEITCSFVTTHVGYYEVPGLLTVERILDVIELTADAMARLRKREPHLVVNGLNPHAGESGLFGGGEEEKVIIPAIEQARAKGLTISGPLPPDTAFLPRRREETDAFVCMFHDQGHIPLKMLAFDTAINTTLGLPIVRTSVDHGTALDIAWQGKAKSGSMILATKLAAGFAGERAAV
ncbi:MAG: 4-hydroxythreonine-4-phosphate dehydrogenase PdxA [Opitutales bacterium]